ncbi:hypothetical protein LZQ00_02900 [Sphingobacterium sp. SRCM116780]|uniref:hypothetical protein n=1 Tax=Sphingobacterium sp. SRCM116780 TaxID=2907623 RepID=UPI001F1A142A|nr:hypothetical protein [Sphingobacterium sp. SRCM116780]UIR56774.1 hypothetical protein LZQ00_02900 [Sphingobacterium sp. SRCM116780]
MKLYKITILLFCLFGTISFVRAQEEDRRNVIDTIKLFAKTPFDADAAKVALKEGNSTIKGKAYLSASSGETITGNQVTVILFPVTPYLEEYLKLKKQENPQKLKFAYINPDAWKNRLEVKTNEYGDFVFTKMKPGDYYLECYIPWQVNGYKDNYTGSDYNTDYYQRGYYTHNYNDLIHEYVSIKKDGSIKKVSLSKRVYSK